MVYKLVDMFATTLRGGITTCTRTHRLCPSGKPSPVRGEYYAKLRVLCTRGVVTN